MPTSKTPATPPRPDKADRPLSGVRVIELANFVSGPSVGMFLADYGAEVIKVEHPSGGDAIRTWGAQKNGVSLFHKVLNRNKRCITADLKSEIGADIVRKLAKTADVVLENFRPGTLEAWGLSYEALSEINPALIMVRVSGFGQNGPYRTRSGFGSLAEAMTGFAYTNGFPDRPPLLPGFTLADASTGLAGAFLTLTALEARRRNGGRGQVVDIGIYEPLVTMLGPHIVEYDQLGIVQERAGSRLPLVAPRGTFETRDGKWIAVSAGSHAIFNNLCRGLGAPELAEDPRFVGNQQRLKNVEELEQILRSLFKNFDQEQALASLSEHGAAAAPVYSVADLVADPQVQARQNVVRVHDDELGCELGMQNVLGVLTRNPGSIEATGEPLGAANRDILIAELGFDEAALKAAGIIV